MLTFRAPFVQDNFLFYTRVLQLFFARACLFDFYASMRPQSSVKNQRLNAANSSKSHLYLDMLDRVMRYFSDPKLIELLLAIETALCSLKSYGASATSGTLSAVSSPIMKSVTSARMSTASRSAGGGGKNGQVDLTYQYRNSGPKTKLHIVSFEGKYHYSPVFIQVPDESKDKNSNLVCFAWVFELTFSAY